MTKILTNKEMPALATATFNTGAGPNLIRKDVLPTSWIVHLLPIRVSVNAAGDVAFRVGGVIRHLVEFGGLKIKAVSGAAPKLATKTILGTSFIDREIDRIETKCRQIIPRSVYTVAIVATFEDKDAVQFSNSIRARLVRTWKPGPAVCRAAKSR